MFVVRRTWVLVESESRVCFVVSRNVLLSAGRRKGMHVWCESRIEGRKEREKEGERESVCVCVHGGWVGVRASDVWCCLYTGVRCVVLLVYRCHVSWYVRA